MKSLFTAGLVAAIGLAGVDTTSAALPAKVVVDSEGPEEAVFAELQRVLAPTVPRTMVSATTKRFDAYVDQRVGTERKRVTLYPGMLAEFIRMAHGAKWTSTQVADFMVYLQKEIDTEARSPTLLLQHVAQEMQTGRSPEQIQSGLEKKEGVTH